MYIPPCSLSPFLVFLFLGRFHGQYTLFLLYASFVHSSRLEELLLGRCGSSVHVAHSLYWFLKAFCVEGAGVTPVGVKAIEQVIFYFILFFIFICVLFIYSWLFFQ